MRWCRVEPTEDSVSRVRAVFEREEREQMQTVVKCLGVHWYSVALLAGVFCMRMHATEAINMLSACTYGSAVSRLLLPFVLL